MKFMKIVAISYLVKTLLVGIAWLFIPDLPQRAAAVFQRTWARIEGPATAPEVVPAAADAAAPPVNAPSKNYTR
jgi:hypothetical protein